MQVLQLGPKILIGKNKYGCGYHYEKKTLFYNWPCNSIFELQRRLATHCIYMV
jgi:hypothetical protein